MFRLTVRRHSCLEAFMLYDSKPVLGCSFSIMKNNTKTPAHKVVRHNSVLNLIPEFLLLLCIVRSVHALWVSVCSYYDACDQLNPWWQERKCYKKTTWAHLIRTSLHCIFLHRCRLCAQPSCGSMHFPVHLHGRMRVRNPGHTALRKHEMCVRASAVHVAAGWIHGGEVVFAQRRRVICGGVDVGLR